jgi:hypothetical protein
MKKEKFKRYSLFLFSFLFILFCYGTAYSEGGLEEIYKNIVTMAKKNTPSAYTVEVENNKFDEALEELPEDILTGKGRPKVKIQFSKGVGVKIIIENIKSEYASLFSMYEEYFKFSGISKVQNPAEFKQIIDSNKANFYEENDEFIVVQAWDPESDVKDDNYALFSLDKNNWVIRKAVYYLDGTPFVQAENSYKFFGNYYMPYRIELIYLSEDSSDVFLFKDYNFNK